MIIVIVKTAAKQVDGTSMDATIESYVVWLPVVSSRLFILIQKHSLFKQDVKLFFLLFEKELKLLTFQHHIFAEIFNQYI